MRSDNFLLLRPPCWGGTDTENRPTCHLVCRISVPQLGRGPCPGLCRRTVPNFLAPLLGAAMVFCRRGDLGVTWVQEAPSKDSPDPGNPTVPAARFRGGDDDDGRLDAETEQRAWQIGRLRAVGSLGIADEPARRVESDGAVLGYSWMRLLVSPRPSRFFSHHGRDSVLRARDDVMIPAPCLPARRTFWQNATAPMPESCSRSIARCHQSHERNLAQAHRTNR